jgi:DNA-binding MarR family transcriptional regulator
MNALPAGHGMSYAMYKILDAVDLCPGQDRHHGVRPVEICAYAMADRATTCSILNKLYKMKLATFRQDKGDMRVNYWRLTEKGTAVLARLKPIEDKIGLMVDEFISINIGFLSVGQPQSEQSEESKL